MSVWTATDFTNELARVRPVDAHDIPDGDPIYSDIDDEEREGLLVIFRQLEEPDRKIAYQATLNLPGESTGDSYGGEQDLRNALEAELNKPDPVPQPADPYAGCSFASINGQLYRLCPVTPGY